MAVLSAEKSAFVPDFSLSSWLVFWLGVVLIVGLSKNRRASILVDLFILALTGIYIAQLLISAHQFEVYKTFERSFAFIPMRYGSEYGQPWTSGGWLAYLWTPFTYAFLHGHDLHLLGNAMALFIFGRTVAWRVGGLNFLWLFALSSAAGAMAHLLFFWGSATTLIGASAGAFGIMGATFRFAPQAEGRLQTLFWPDETLRQLPLAGIGKMLTDRRSLVYIFICMIIYPLGLIAFLAGVSGRTAVMAHVGGFAFGILSFGYFDRHRPVFQPAHHRELEADKKTTSMGFELLRLTAVLMMIFGILLGVVFYYLPLLLI